MSNKFIYEKALKEAVKRIRLEYTYKCKDFNMNCHECQMHLAGNIMEDELMLVNFYNSKKGEEVKKDIEKYLKGFANKKK